MMLTAEAKVTLGRTFTKNIPPPTKKNVYKEHGIGKFRENELHCRKLAIYIYFTFKYNL